MRIVSVTEYRARYPITIDGISYRGHDVVDASKIPPLALERLLRNRKLVAAAVQIPPEIADALANPPETPDWMREAAAPESAQGGAGGPEGADAGQDQPAASDAAWRAAWAADGAGHTYRQFLQSCAQAAGLSTSGAIPEILARLAKAGVTPN